MTADERLDVTCGHCSRTVRATRHGAFAGRFLPDPHQLSTAPPVWCMGAKTTLGHSLPVAPISPVSYPAAGEVPHPGSAARVGTTISGGAC